ncbi:MAG: DUF5979 domain-containing protein, partial [Chloroflexota bacterium]
VTGLPIPAGIDVDKQVAPSLSGPWTATLDTVAGTNVWWRIRVVNTGPQTLTGVTLTDSLTDLVAAGCVIPTTLAAGEAFECIYQGLSIDGTLTNTVTAGADGVTADRASAQVTGSVRVAMTIEKLVATDVTGPWQAAVSVPVGTIVWFRIVVTNTGNVPLTGVTLLDDRLDLAGAGCAIPTTLAVGATFTCLYPEIAGEGTFANTATADSAETPPVHGTAWVTGIRPVVGPLLITKQVSTSQAGPWAGSLTVAPGTTVWFRITLTNGSSETALTGVTLADDRTDLVAAGCTIPTTLAAGETFTCIYGDVALVGTRTNTATGSSNETGPVSASAIVIAPPESVVDLRIDKLVATAADGPWSDLVSVVTGATVWYRVAVTNLGPDALTGLLVSDSLTDLVVAGCTFPTSLAAGASAICVYAATAADGTTVNTATASGDGVGPVSDSATVVASVGGGGGGAIGIAKEVRTPGDTYGKSVTVAIGATVEYRITVTNIGTGDLTGISLVDSLADLSAIGATCTIPTTLAAGASFTCTYSMTAAAGAIVNTATVDAAEAGPASSSATVIGLPAALAISKTVVDPASGDDVNAVTVLAGTSLTFHIVVTNIGLVTLTGLSLLDTRIDLATTGCVIPASLAPGASFTCTYTSDAPLGTSVNTATADAAETDPVSDSVTVVGLQRNPVMVITKQVATIGGPWTTYLETYDGAVIQYRITLHNGGNVVLTGLSLVDDQTDLAAAGCTVPSSLAVGATYTCIYGAFAVHGTTVNTATGESNETGARRASAVVVAFSNPQISITKGVSSSAAGPFWSEIWAMFGTLAHYEITVTNTGNVPLSGVTLADTRSDLAGCSIPSSLAVGASFTCTYTTFLPAMGVTIVNTATADSAQTAPVSASATVHVFWQQQFDLIAGLLRITKVVTGGSFSGGTFDFYVSCLDRTVSITIPDGSTSGTLLLPDKILGGTSCTVTELGTEAWAGTTYEPSDIGGASSTLTISGGAIADVTVTNSAGSATGQLRITKLVTGGSFDGATFQFTVSCLDRTVSIVMAQGATSGSLLLADQIPAGTPCTVTELNTDAWQGTTYDPSDAGGASSTVTIAADGIADVTVTNVVGSETGQLRITKNVVGTLDGGTFEFTVSCLDKTVSIMILPGSTTGSILLPDRIPSGTPCTVTELNTEAWQGTAYDPNDLGGASSTVVIGTDSIADVTVTNTRSVLSGRLRITKNILVAALFPGGTFAFAVSCLDRTVSITIAKGQSSGTILLPDLIPAGTSCTVREIGLANLPFSWFWSGTSYSPSDPGGKSSTVVIPGGGIADVLVMNDIDTATVDTDAGTGRGPADAPSPLLALLLGLLGGLAFLAEPERRRRGVRRHARRSDEKPGLS